jgi:hypothetical protein
MRMMFVALASVALVGFARSTQAAPIQVLSLRGPDEVLNRAGAPMVPGVTIDPLFPDEITYLNLGGFQGNLNLGSIVKPNLPPAAYSALRFAWQATFTSGIVEFPAMGTMGGFVPPFGEAGFWYFPVPEPAACGMAAMSIVGVVAVARRRVAGRT